MNRVIWGIIEISAEQYRANARRCHDLAAQWDGPMRKVLYLQMERSYLTLADSQEILSRPPGEATTKA
jgi:hypothetical protein